MVVQESGGGGGSRVVRPIGGESRSGGVGSLEGGVVGVQEVVEVGI